MKTLPLSTGLTMSRNLIDLIFPKPGSDKKPLYFIVLSDGDNVYVRCLNGNNYNFQPKTFDGLMMTSQVSPSECVVTADGIGSVEVRPNLDRDRVVMVELRKPAECDCGKCTKLIIRIPSIRAGAVIGVDTDAQMHDHLHRKAASETQSRGTNPVDGRRSSSFADLFSGDPLGGEGGDLGGIESLLALALLGGGGLGFMSPGRGGANRKGSSRRETAGSSS